MPAPTAKREIVVGLHAPSAPPKIRKRTCVNPEVARKRRSVKGDVVGRSPLGASHLSLMP